MDRDDKDPPVTDLARIEGLFVGQLTDDELRGFNQACADGRAVRSYDGAAGFLDVPKVKIIRPEFD